MYNAEQTIDECSLFNEAYQNAFGYVNHYTANSIYRNLVREGTINLNEGVTFSEMVEILEIKPIYQPLLKWAMAYLQQLDLLNVNNGRFQRNKTYTFPYPRPVSTNVQASINLINYISLYWLDILRGKKKALSLLFNQEGTILWDTYFNNSHDLYSPHNQWAAEIAVADLPEKATILELGAGYGSASESLLFEHKHQRLNSISNYILTDVSPYLIKPTGKKVTKQFPELSLELKKLNVNQIDLTDTNQTVDLIYAVNVLHCSKDLEYSLRELKELLRPGGQIVISECVRSDYDTRMHQEYIFSLLPDFQEIQTNTSAPCYGFLTANDWENIFRKSGYHHVEMFKNSGEDRGIIIKAN
ncbi:class I SAM-dependent methyltransferase [Fictibacillus enclensis]|uniref:class I SAM-dependent methyltransferase n=1 Tax=Fictibacillus enclensis TaxID=1017270 RepID=UPI0025A09FDC|nr:class I SAM-dependent methyltransferase [Fictibacillus enclensis]MDM5335839.1 class I SAM-dependent methyltransferase [Fictibacillus enclensis]